MMLDLLNGIQYMFDSDGIPITIADLGLLLNMKIIWQPEKLNARFCQDGKIGRFFISNNEYGAVNCFGAKLEWLYGTGLAAKYSACRMSHILKI